MVGPIRFDGLASGIDFGSIIEQLLSVERRPIVQLQERIAQETERKTALLDVSARMLSLRSSATQLARPSFFGLTSTASSNENVLEAIGNNVGATGSYTFGVRQLAQSHRLITGGFADRDDTTFGPGTFRIEKGNGFVDTSTEVGVLNKGEGIDRGKIRITDANGNQATVDLEAARTIDDIVDAINGADGISINARVDADRLTIQDTSGGAGTLQVDDVGLDTTAEDLGIAGSDGDADGFIYGASVNGIDEDAALGRLNDGLGIRHTNGDDLRIIDTNGNNILVDVESSDQSLGDIIDKINDASTAAGSGIVASVNTDGTGLLLTDTTPGAAGSTISVSAENSSTAGVDLGLIGISSESSSSGQVGDAGSANDRLIGGRITSSLNSVLRSSLNGGNVQHSGSDLYAGVGDGTVRITDSTGAAYDIDVSARVENALQASPGGNIAIGQDFVDLASVDGLAVGNKIRIAGDSGKEIVRTITDINSGTGRVTFDEASDVAITADNARAFGVTDSLADIVRVINEGTGGAVVASINSTGNGLTLSDEAGGSGSLTAEDLAGTAAEELGIVNRGLADSGTTTTIVDSSLAGYMDGQFVGATVEILAGTNAGKTATITGFDAASGTLTVDSAFGAAIDATSEYRINFDDDAISGRDLERQYIGENTKLDTLNGGGGVYAGKIQISDRSGLSFKVDLRQDDDDNIGEVIDEINSASAVAGSAITARINDSGDGILIEDASGTGSAIQVIDLENGTTARDLNIRGEGSSGSEGTIDGTFEEVISFDSASTLEEIMEALNEADAGISASIINDGSGVNPYRLQISSLTTGLKGRLAIDNNLEGFSFNTSAQAQDAYLLFGQDGGTEDPVLLTNDENRFVNVVSGMDLNLRSISDDNVTVTVDRDDSGVIDQIQRFTDAYNDVQSKIKEFTRFDAESFETGVLFNESVVRTVERDLARIISLPVNEIPSGELRTLGQIGIKLGQEGQLLFDSGKFQDELDEDPDAVKDLFTRLRRLEIDTEIDDLRGGLGIETVSSADDFRIFLRNGESIDVNLDNSDTLGDILNRINLDAENSGDLVANIGTNGFSFVLSDNSSLISRDADSGTTTSFIDSALAGVYDDDFFIGAQINFTSGANSDEVRTVIDYDGATGEFTLDSGDPLSVAVAAADTYEVERALSIEGLNNSRAARQMGIETELDFGKTVLKGRVLTATGHPGVGARIRDRLEFLTRSPDGVIPTRAASIENSISSFEDDIERIEERITNKEISLVQEFSRLEQIMSSSQSTLAQLQSGLSGLIGL